jgi:hypothetical protein
MNQKKNHKGNYKIPQDTCKWKYVIPKLWNVPKTILRGKFRVVCIFMSKGRERSN